MVLQEFVNTYKIPINSLDLLKKALTHKSAIADTNAESNEVLEFLGDSFLGFVITHYLVKSYPELSEGELSQVKSNIVSKHSLFEIGKKLHLEQVLNIQGFKIDSSKISAPIYDAVEALIGAVYLDQGYEIAQTFVLNYFTPLIDRVITGLDTRDYKSLLQNLTQKYFFNKPSYIITHTKGPDHNKIYFVEDKIYRTLETATDTNANANANDSQTIKTFGPTEGNTKKEAEQHAAKLAFEYFNDICEEDGTFH